MKDTVKAEGRILLGKIASAILTFLSALLGGVLGNGGAF